MRGARKISTMVVVAAGFALSPAAAQATPASGVANPGPEPHDHSDSANPRVL